MPLKSGKVASALNKARRYASGGAVDEAKVPARPGLIPEGYRPERIQEYLTPPRDDGTEQIIPDRPYKLPPRKRRIARRYADGGGIEDMSPVDLMRLRAELPDRRTDEERAAARRQNRIEALDMILGGRTAAEMGRDVASAETPLGAAAQTGIAALEAGLGVWGSPFGRAAGDAAREGATTARIFAGPSAKTADMDAYAKALEMRARGRHRDTIWKETGWGWDKGDNPFFEIDDSSATFNRGAEGVIRNSNPRASALRASDELFEHPYFYAAYPEARHADMMIKRGGGTGEFMPNTGAIKVEPRTVPEGNSIALHELQHRVQRDEGWAPGGGWASSMEGMDAFHQERSKILLQLYDDPKFADLAKQPGALYKLANAMAREKIADDWYTRNRGEVQARNTEARKYMSAAERRDRPPWLDEDVDEAKQIYTGSVFSDVPQPVFSPADPGPKADLAREMREEGRSGKDITKETGLFFGPEGALKVEIPDRFSRIKRPTFGKGNVMPAREVIAHPQLFDRHPSLGEIPVKFDAGMNRFSSRPGQPRGLAYTDRETGEFRLTQDMEPDFYKEMMAKLLNYRLAEKYGFGHAVGHSKEDAAAQYDNAMRMAQDIIDNPRPGEDIGAAQAYLNKMTSLRAELETDPLKALHSAQNFTSGNVDSRIIRSRAMARDHKVAMSQGANPYQAAIKHIGEKRDRFQILPQPGTDRAQMARMLEDWQTYGAGRPGFARGGRVARALKRAKAITGAVRGKTGGRDDALPVSVPAGSYVVPADVVAAIGGGNTEAGMGYLDRQFGRQRRTNGGRAVPILISDGEYVISPEGVESAGGHDRLDELVTQTRNAYAQHLQSLPGPNK